MATLILRDTHRALEEKMKSLDKLKKETSLKIRDAASHGDLKENAEYHAAREEQSFIVRKTQSLQTHSPFQIIEFSEIETDKVGFGNKVTIREEGKDEAEDYYLLGPIEFELDLYPMIVTYHSPFGQAIVGKKIDEDFTLEIKGKETKFTITAIEKISAEWWSTLSDANLLPKYVPVVSFNVIWLCLVGRTKPNPLGIETDGGTVGMKEAPTSWYNF